ncbi:hypothetical protein ACIP5Y_21365 [Nocardia sp. NPDC088792]|uniref:hypothetical protein n=1 Tax=Nocardia sp. NPDC088792 TaxID=3364332 RepID=UPI003808A342
MMATITFTVPPSWSTEAELDELTCEAPTVGAAIEWFADRYPSLRKRYLTVAGDIAPWALVTLDHVDVRTLSGLNTCVASSEGEIGIIAALMGG